jgi:hypothetical protein
MAEGNYVATMMLPYGTRDVSSIAYCATMESGCEVQACSSKNLVMVHEHEKALAKQVERDTSMSSQACESG